MIESAGLNIYFANGQNIEVGLTALQLKTVMVALGLSFHDERYYSCIADKDLPAIIDHLQQKIRFKS